MKRKGKCWKANAKKNESETQRTEPQIPYKQLSWSTPQWGTNHNINDTVSYVVDIIYAQEYVR